MSDLRAGVLLLTVAWCGLAQNSPTTPPQEPPPSEQPADQYFSGIVVSYAGEKVTVARTAPGKNSASRDFMITPGTQIEGKLRVKVRVTVQYIVKDDVDYAVHIIVRTQAPRK